MKIYRPMIDNEGEPVMVEEDKDMMNDTSERCIMLDDLQKQVKLLFKLLKKDWDNNNGKHNFSKVNSRIMETIDT